MRWTVGLLGALWLTGCYASAGYATGSSGYATTTQPVATAQPAYTPPPQAACTTCVQGAQEVCNGCDDNCNGAIDENCVSGAQPAMPPPPPPPPPGPPPGAACTTCVQGAREICNGCDDNCNGAIDENCVSY